MKTIMVLAAALGLSVMGAAADCSWHSKVSASADTQTKVGNVDKPDATKVADVRTTKQDEAKAD